MVSVISFVKYNSLIECNVFYDYFRLYPVDKKRIDDGTEVVDAPADETKPLLEKKTE